MKNHSYNRGQNRFIDSKPVKTTLQVIDVLNEKKAFTGNWASQIGKFFTIKLCMCTVYRDGSTDFEILETYPGKSSKAWPRWRPVVEAVKEKNQILEITGTFDILPKKGKHRVVKELSKFKITDRFKPEDFKQMLGTFLGAELPKDEPDLFKKDK